MAQQSAAELCTLVVEDIYGPIPSKVVALLLQTDRLPKREISRRLKLPERTVNQTLAVLIQQHLVAHYTYDEGDGGQRVTYYDCQWEQVYELFHAGKIIRAVEQRFGSDGAMVVSNVLQLGHVRVADFLAAYGRVEKRGRGRKDATAEKKGKGKGKGKEESKEEGEKTNGTAGAGNGAAGGIETDGSPVASVETLKEVMGRMLEERFLVEVQQHHMHPRIDTVKSIRQDLTRKLRAQIKTESKLLKEVEGKVQEKMAELINGSADPHAGMNKLVGSKRKFAKSDNKKSNKRQKLMELGGDDDEEVQWEIREDVVVRVNHEKFLVLFRNEELVALAKTRCGEATARVYEEFLKLVEPRYRRCREPYLDPADEDDPKKKIKLSAYALSKSLPKDVDLSNSIACPEKPKKKKRKRSNDSSDSSSESSSKRSSRRKKRSTAEDSPSESEEVDEWAEDYNDDSDSDSDSKTNGDSASARMTLIIQHCTLLAEDSTHFLTPSPGRSKNPEWSVPYAALSGRLRALELEKVVQERFNDVGTRLLRIVKDKGKLDEKQIANIALISQKEIRATLSGLRESGHLELQEVPKTNPPQLRATYFFYYHDEERAQRMLLAEVFKAMARAVQRANVEREKRSAVLEKSERSDVRENSDYLTRAEKEQLEVWRSGEERLLGQIMRLDRLVMILKDF